MFGLPLPLLALSMLFSIALCVHVVRAHQEMYWLWIILAFQPLGGIVYIVAVLLPAMTGGSTARRMAKAASETLDPGRAYREAKAAYDDAPTVQNMMKLAEASGAHGRWAEAEGLYAQASQGLYADDPALLFGRARALLELDRPADALAELQKLEKDREGRISPQAELALARALHGVGRNEEAERAFKSAAQRVPGLEAMARYTAFLAEQGRQAEARETLAEIEKRAAKTQIGRAHV
mgnify:CR=1 FL=1